MNPEPPETSEIQAFVLAVDEGSVSGASRALGSPRATVSRRLARLEERLGVRLLHRTTRELSLTEAGEEYYAYGRAVLDAVNVATAAVQRPGDDPRGRLRVSVMPTGNAVFREMLLLFAEAYPLVDLEIIVAAAVLDLREGKVDVALRASAELDGDLIARKLLSSRVGAFASPAYLARQGTPTDPGQLARHVCLLGFAGGERAVTHWPLMEGGEVRVVGGLVSNDIALLRDAAVRGLGIALLPAAYSAARVADGSLVPVLSDHVGAVSTIALVYPDRRFLKPAVRAFVEHVVVHFPRMLLSLDAAGPDGEGAGVAAGPLAGGVEGRTSGAPVIPLPTGWNLRVVTPATAAADSLAVAAHIASIYTEFGLEFDLQFEDDLIDLDASYSTGCFWIIEGAGRIQATAAILPHGGARIFKRLYIAPSARRGGIARALFRLACAWGDFPRTELWSDVRFRNAHQLYLSEGFLQGPTRVLDDPDRSVERSFWSPPLARPRLVLA